MCFSGQKAVISGLLCLADNVLFPFSNKNTNKSIYSVLLLEGQDKQLKGWRGTDKHLTQMWQSIMSNCKKIQAQAR